MGDDFYSLMDDLDSRRMRRDTSQYSLLQPQFKNPAQPIPPRDRYRSTRRDAGYDVVEDDEQYGEEPPFDSFDERLLQQPYEDRQRRATAGQARLTFPPQPSKFFAPAPTASSQVQPSFRAREDASYDHGGKGQHGHPQQRAQPAFGRFTYGATQPQGSSSDTQLGPSSSPALRAAQRRVENGQSIPAQPAKRTHPFGEEPSGVPHHQRQQPSQQLTQAPTSRHVPSIAEELHVDTPVIQGIPIVPISVLPDRLRTVFPYPTFNAVQSKCFDNVYRSDNNFVLASPTGSGKTVILELAICRAVATNATGQYKIVYQAPTKALCSERQRDWQKKFSQVGLNCVELTGDSEAADLRGVQTANIIITTPEKWDSITRKWKDHEKLMRLIKLFLIDEVHILKEDRGAILEAVVSRMKSIGTDVRFVALSATVPNFDDVATWLGRNSLEPYEPAVNEKFGEEFRPVRLRKHVCGYTCNSNNDFAFEKVLDGQLPGVIKKYSERKPIMVFCFTRNSTLATAKMLANWWAETHPKERRWNAPSRSISFQNRDLRECAASGVAFHHAGLDLNDRNGVEKAFLGGEINVICCTSTLAVGVNLPCHFVIIKNTVTFTNDGVQEYADLEIMQMLGRAGRPQFDDSAVAVIMTRQSKVRKYEKTVTGQEILESTLHLNLTDHLNAEIGLGTIRDLLSARQWLTGTFLYVRLKRNPTSYKLEGSRSGQDFDEQLDDICYREITNLRNTNLIAGEEYFRCTELGHAMARYYIHFPTMQIFSGLQSKASVSEILSAIAQASEFDRVRFRSGEKNLYRVINKSPYIRFPIPVNLDLPAHKVSLVIQSILGSSDIAWDSEFAKHKVQYNMDAMIVFKHLSRLIRCIIDCQLTLGDSVSISNALLLERSLAARVWDDSPWQMKQIEGLGVVAVRKLANAGIRTIEELEYTDAHRIDVILGKNPPFGLKVLEKLTQFPKLRVSLHVQPSSITKASDGVKLLMKADIGFINEKPPEAFGSKLVYVCFLVETSDGRKVHFARISSKKLGKGQTLEFPALLTSPDLCINCYIMCEGIAGTMRSASVKPKIAPSMFPAPKSPASTMPCPPRPPTSNMSRRRTETPIPARKPSSESDEFGNDGIDDDELVKASFHDLDFDHIDNYANPFNNIARKNTAKNSSAKGKCRAKAAEQAHEDEGSEPRQLDNGKWACNHKCKDKKICKHICCREGLDKPPKKSTAKRVPSNEDRFQSGPKTAVEKEKKIQTKLQLKASKRKTSAAVEEIDLTQQEKRRKSEFGNNSPRDYRDLHKLHRSVQKHEPPSSISSIRHQKPAYCYSKGEGYSLSFLEDDVATGRPGSISTDYGDIQFDDLLPQSETSKAGRVQSTAAKRWDEEDIRDRNTDKKALDDRSDTFGEDDSLFGDAVVGLLDSEKLRAANEDPDAGFTAIEDGLDFEYGAELGDDDFPIDVDSDGLEEGAPWKEPKPLPTSSTLGFPSIRPEKGRSLFLNDTSSPQPTYGGFKPAKSMLKGSVVNDLSQVNAVPRASKQKSTGATQEIANIDLAGDFEDPEKDNIEPQEKVVPDAFKDLEPWFYEEFGDVVELVDG